MGFLDDPKHPAPDPHAAEAREAIRKVRGGEGVGRAGETITDEEGRARESGQAGGEKRKPKR
jgi:hypothetical protein